MRMLTQWLVGLLVVGSAGAAEPPNLVVFLADDHGWLDSSVYGSPSVQTPTMNQLAETGMVFTHAFVASPACGPSRSALFSGLMPTLLEFAGGTVPENIDGRSFANVLLGQADVHREVIYTTHSGDGVMNVFPIRAIRTQRFKYIRNLRPDCYHSNHSDILRKDGAGAYWDSWDAAAAVDPSAAAVVAKYYQRPAVEFYDLDHDPTEQVNLAGDPKYRVQMERLSSMLNDWMDAQGDTQRLFREPYPVSGLKPVEVHRRRTRGRSDP